MLICLDAEFANGNRMLELAIHDSRGDCLFHHYFKPGDLHRWRTDIHHITPEMVRHERPFKAYCAEIQRIIDGASHVIGFAVNNDFEKMAREGILRLADKPVVELRDWYWMCVGRYEGDIYGSGPGLGAVAERFGFHFDEGAEHTASGDTLMTLHVFGSLLDIFREKFLSVEQRRLPVERQIELFGPIYEREREPYERERAHGYCQLLLTPRGYKLKCSHINPDTAPHDPDSPPRCPVAATIEVNCRHTAELELRRMLSRRADPHMRGIYDLRPADIERFSAYSNSFDMATSHYNRLLLKMSSMTT